MKKLMLLMMVLLMAGSSFAIVDPDDDMMGLYFDLSAEYPCVSDATAYSTHMMYLFSTNPSSEMLFGFEAGYDMVGPAQVLSTTFPGHDWLNVGTGDNMIVGMGSPYPTSPATLLATIAVLYMSTANETVDFFLHGSTPPSIPGELPVVLLDNGVLMQVGLSAAEGPTAQINGEPCMVVATEKVTFDNIKSLYR